MRLFVALPVASDALAAARRMAASLPGVRLVPEGSWHVTLRFLGEQADPAPVEEALDGVLQDERAIMARVAGGGGFPRLAQARVLWAGVHAPRLEALAARVVAGTAHLGRPADARPFAAHVTLARCREPVDARGWATALQGRALASGPLAKVVLMRSDLGPGGPAHLPLRTWALAEP